MSAPAFHTDGAQRSLRASPSTSHSSSRAVSRRSGEARDRNDLSRALQSLATRIAKRLNHLWRRAGRLFADRYHDHILRMPREVRNALAYVLDNAIHHGSALIRGRPDP